MIVWINVAQMARWRNELTNVPGICVEYIEKGRELPFFTLSALSATPSCQLHAC